jgi:hypothetical protein
MVLMDSNSQRPAVSNGVPEMKPIIALKDLSPYNCIEVQEKVGIILNY